MGSTFSPPAPPLLLQPSSFAGYAGIVGAILNVFVLYGVPNNTAGWIAVASQILAAVAAIVTNPGGSVADTGILVPPKQGSVK
jgi:hypothetical protein